MPIELSLPVKVFEVWLIIEFIFLFEELRLSMGIKEYVIHGRWFVEIKCEG